MSGTSVHFFRSPQWWSGRSTTSHIVLRSAFTNLGIWRKLYDCSLHHFTSSQDILECAYWHFRQPPIDWLKFENCKGVLSTPVLGVHGARRGSGLGPLDSPPVDSYYLPIDSYGLSLTVLSYLGSSKSVSPARPNARSTRMRWQISLYKV